MYAKVAEAYIRGLERRRDGGQVDRRRALGGQLLRLARGHRGRQAARGARPHRPAGHRRGGQRARRLPSTSRRSSTASASPRCARPARTCSARSGPRPARRTRTTRRRSTSTSLVAPDTVNTMPMPTLLAFAERGEVHGRHRRRGPGQVDAELKALADAGIDMEDVTAKLLRGRHRAVRRGDDEAARRRSSARRAGGRHRAARRDPARRSRTSWSTRVAERVQRALEEDVARRVWRRDESLWGGPGVPEIGNRLGWLTIAETMLEEADALEAFARDVAAEGLTDAVLLGMGGSSLAPEVLRRTFGAPRAALDLHVLDSTDPARSCDVERQHRPRAHALHRLDQVRRDDRDALAARATSSRAPERRRRGRRRAPLHRASPIRAARWWSWPRTHGFRRVFLNDPDIGGRYSALSHFGWCRRRSRASTSGRCSSARRWPSSAARTTSRARPTPASGSAR